MSHNKQLRLQLFIILALTLSACSPLIGKWEYIQGSGVTWPSVASNHIEMACYLEFRTDHTIYMEVTAFCGPLRGRWEVVDSDTLRLILDLHGGGGPRDYTQDYDFSIIGDILYFESTSFKRLP